MIEINNLSFSYGEELVIKDWTFSIRNTGITAIVAPSGNGKTTLLRLVAGLEKIQTGSITGVPDRISYVFQEERLLPWLSALENVSVVNSNASPQKATELLLSLGIDEKLQNKLPQKLSGGQRRRVCVARALFFDGDLLLLDEPFTGLDAVSRELVLAKIKEYSKTKPVILVSHIKEDIATADNVISLEYKN